MKKTQMLCSILVLMLVTSVCLSGCGLLFTEKKEDNPPAITSPKDDPELQEDPVKEVGTQKIGSDEYGYLDIPANWVKFSDKSVEDIGTDNPFIAFSNKEGTEIVKMLAVETDTQKAETMAMNLMDSFEQEGFKDLTGARVNDTGFEGFQVYGIAPGEIMHMVWTFEDGVGKSHYISVQGKLTTDTSVFDIPKSYSLTK